MEPNLESTRASASARLRGSRERTFLEEYYVSNVYLLCHITGYIKLSSYFIVDNAKFDYLVKVVTTRSIHSKIHFSQL